MGTLGNFTTNELDAQAYETKKGAKIAVRLSHRTAMAVATGNEETMSAVTEAVQKALIEAELD